MKKLLKKLICSICTISLCISMIVLPTQASDGIHVQLDGQELLFDVPPQIINDRTMVPMRTIFEALGYGVEWDQQEQTIYAIRQPQYIMMSIGSTRYFDFTISDLESDTPSDNINEKSKELDVPPQIIGGRTLVPLRAVSEMSGCKVSWDGETRTITITSDKAESFEPSSFEILKNAILSKGEYDTQYKNYVIFKNFASIGYPLSDAMITLESDNLITLSCFDDTNNLKKSVLFLITPNEVPYASIQVDDYISEKTLNGIFSSTTHKFITLDSDMSSKQEAIAIDFMNIFAEILDALLEEYNIGVTLNDLGISY